MLRIRGEKTDRFCRSHQRLDQFLTFTQNILNINISFYLIKGMKFIEINKIFNLNMNFIILFGNLIVSFELISLNILKISSIHIQGEMSQRRIYVRDI